MFDNGTIAFVETDTIDSHGWKEMCLEQPRASFANTSYDLGYPFLSKQKIRS